MTKQSQYLTRYVVLLFGLVIVALGIAMTIRAELGVSPWTVFHIGVGYLTGLSVGRITQLVGLVLVVLGSLILKEKPGVGTVLNMLLVGWFLDLFLISQWLPTPGHIGTKILFLVVGIFLFGCGTGIYISVRLGAGPRDAIMLGLSRLSGWKVGRVRSTMEASVLVVGFFMGGPVGLGTLAGIALGPIVQWSLYWMNRLWGGVLFGDPRHTPAHV